MSESKQQWTPGPWEIERNRSGTLITAIGPIVAEEYAGIASLDVSEKDANLAKAAPDLAEIAIKARAALAAYLDDHPHVSPHDCYATGPKTGDQYHDLVRCPGCCAQEAFTGLIAGIDAALAKAGA
ncbi:hypothetical protein [Burkholderia glumae]